MKRLVVLILVYIIGGHFRRRIVILEPAPACTDVLLQFTSRLVPNHPADDYGRLGTANKQPVAPSSWWWCGKELQHGETRHRLEPCRVLGRRSFCESVFADVAAKRAIHISFCQALQGRPSRTPNDGFQHRWSENICPNENVRLESFGSPIVRLKVGRTKPAIVIGLEHRPLVST